MTLESSVRVSTQEHDLKQRSTKKVKMREELDLNKDGSTMEVSSGNETVVPPQKISYKDSLLSSPGDMMEDHEEIPEELFDNSPNLDDQWHQKDGDDDEENTSFNPCPTIPVTKEEFDEWCNPWQAALIVKLLGKKVNRGFMEQRMNKDWAKK
ncbi:hypothetical protein PIB30_086629, partial [Stylosanthes scabra]|nr:hypothetical protein [Stylosanthes scabra]